MKNRNKIAAIILTLVISLMAHPFNVVKAEDVNVDIQSFSSSNNNVSGHYSYTYQIYDVNRNVDIDGTSFYGATLVTLDIYFDQYVQGEVDVTFDSSMSQYLNSDFNIFVDGAIFHDLINSVIQLETSGTNHIRLVLGCPWSYTQFSVLSNGVTINSSLLTVLDGSVEELLQDIDIKLAGQNITLDQIYTNTQTIATNQTTLINYLNEVRTKFTSLNSYVNTLQNTLIKYTNNAINNSMFWVNSAMSDYLSKTVNLTSQNYYFWKFGSNNPRDVKNIGFRIQPSFKFEGNYLVFDITLRTQQSGQVIPWSDLLLSTSKGTSNEFYIYVYYEESRTNTEIYSFILYVPLGVITINDQYNSLDRIQIAFNLNNVFEYDFAFYGCADNLPDKEPANNKDTTKDNINDAVNNLNNLTDQTNTVNNDATNRINEFNQNVDPFNYDYSNDFVELDYFKQRINDIYSMKEFRPFYLIPIMLYILLRILG